MDIQLIRQDIHSLLNFEHTIIALDYSTADSQLSVSVQTKIGDMLVTLKASDTSIIGVTDTLNFQYQLVCESINTTRIYNKIKINMKNRALERRINELASDTMPDTDEYANICDELVSLIESLESKEDDLTDEIYKLNKEIDYLKDEITDLKEQI